MGIGGLHMTENDLKKQEDLTEEEFLELVLEEQQKAIEEERRRRLEGSKKGKKQTPVVRLIVWGLRLSLCLIHLQLFLICIRFRPLSF